MMHDEIIHIENHETPEQKIKEERKANGRLVAVIVALFLLFLAIYHAWIRKIAVLAGVLIPALIMILYGGWVIFLAKRDKQRRILLARQIQEKTRREMFDSRSTINSVNLKNFKENAVLLSSPTSSSRLPTSNSDNSNSILNKTRNHRRKKNKNKKNITSTSSHIAKKWRDKKLSFRHQIFKLNSQTESLIKYRKKSSIKNSLGRSFSMPY